MAYIPGFGHLSNPYIVFNDANGKPLSNGTVETYIAGTTTAYNTLKDWNGTYNGAIITLDIYGGCTIIAPETQGLKLIVKTSTGSLYKTFPNVFIGGSNQGYLPGTTTIRVDGTDGEIISVGTPDPDDPDKLIFTISLDPAITEAIATNASDIGGIQTHINNIDNSIIMINDTLDTLQTDVDIIESDVDTLQSDVGIVESDVAALKLSDQYTTFKATTVAGAAGYIFKIATALKTNAPLTSTTILEYDLTNNYIAKINAAWAMRGHVVHQQIMQMDDQYSSVDYMHYMHIYEFSDRWELWGQTKADWAGDISVRPSKNISINTTIHVNPWVFVGKAVSGSLPTVYTEHNWIDYTMPVNDSKKTSVWAEGAGTSDHKVMIDENDQGAKYLNDKILTGGILIKSIEAAGEVGNWYEVLRLTATLYTDGVTCSGTGTAEDPITVFRDVSDNQNTWYLDTVNGLDTNSGLSRSAPKKTGDAVVIACKTAGKTMGRLVVMAGSGTEVLAPITFTATNWSTVVFPFPDIVVESITTRLVFISTMHTDFNLSNGIVEFNSCSLQRMVNINVQRLTLNGGVAVTTFDNPIILKASDRIVVNGVVAEDVLFDTPILIVKALGLYGRNEFRCGNIEGSGTIFNHNNAAFTLDIQTNQFSFEGAFQFASQAANSSIKITAAKMQRTATTPLLYLGAVANVTVNYQIIVDTMGSIVPLQIGDPAGSVVGKVIELLKYENKVDAEIIRATAAEALKANKLTTVNNSTDTAYTFLASDANTCHIVNTSAATTRTVPSDTTAPDIAIGDSIEVQNIGTGVVTFVAASGVTIRSSLTLVMYGQYSVCMLRKIAANTWILTGERTAV